MTQVQGRGRAAALPHRGATVGHRGRHAAPVPRPGRGRHHPRDRPGRRHRRGHDLPGLRRQDRAPRRGHRGRARPRAHRTRPSRAIDAALPFEDRLVAAVEILRQRVLYVFRVFSVASGTTRGHVDRTRSAELPALIAIFEADGRAPDPLAGRRRAHPARPHVRVRAPVVRHRRAAHVGGDRRGAPRRHPPPERRGAVVLIKLIREYLLQVPEVADPRPRVPDDPVGRDVDPPHAEREHHRQHRERRADTATSGRSAR